MFFFVGAAEAPLMAEALAFWVAEFYKDLQSTFGIPILDLFVNSQIMLCSTGFHIFKLYQAGALEQLFKQLCMFAALISHEFVYFWFGSHLNAEVSSFRNDVYACEWTERSAQFKRSYRIILERIKRGVTIQAVILPTNLATFAKHHRYVVKVYSPSSKGLPIACALSFKDIFRTPEVYHESRVSTVLQPIRSSWKNSPPFSRLPKMAYRSLTIAGLSKSSCSAVFSRSSQILLRANPPEECRLCEDASSGAMSRNQTHTPKRHRST
ncbi:hypothetical protein J6590_098382 [Homalodisca vitripennis]|nr:hypothetical protein J6590_044077 [Homalodisca vitripennis]KAG8319110.1 hypothetical protein J6590_098382 [Homalodisca vitripennis]